MDSLLLYILVVPKFLDYAGFEAIIRISKIQIHPNGLIRLGRSIYI
jgi:hypothetical protein